MRTIGSRPPERPWDAVFSEEDLQVYELYRRPGRSEMPWESSALLVIDVTYAFLGERLPTLEAARRLRTACGLPAWEALPSISRLLEAFRGAGRPVICTVAADERVHGGSTIGRAEDGPGNEIVSEIAAIDGDIVIPKARASAFFGTPLASLLVRSGVRGLVVVGGTSSGCVRATVVDALSSGFVVAVAHDACFDRSPLSHAVALQELDVKYASVLDSAGVVAALTGIAGGRSPVTAGTWPR
jgi:maleamate amidohydrolase